VEVTKEFTFDMAHLLYGHEGLCNNVHGHTYKLLVTVQGNLIESGSSKGMVIDFKDLKDIVGRFIEQFDHAFVYDAYNETETEIGQFLADRCMKIRPFHTRTTCENMSVYFFNTLASRLDSDEIKLSEIILYETPTSYARCRSDENQ